MLLHNGTTSALCLLAGLALALPGASRPAVPAWQLVVAFAGGMASWTLVEYLVHRFVFHRLLPHAHAKHHQKPLDPKYLHGPTHIVVATWLTALVVYVPLLGWSLGLVAVAGLNLAFLGFELLHAVVHQQGGHPLLRPAKHWHAHHHHVNGQTGHGFVSPVWDLWLGTWPERANTPKWLVWALPVPLPLVHFVLASWLPRRRPVALV
jgi:hypothetical protein